MAKHNTVTLNGNNHKVWLYVSSYLSRQHIPIPKVKSCWCMLGGILAYSTYIWLLGSFFQIHNMFVLLQCICFVIKCILSECYYREHQVQHFLKCVVWTLPGHQTPCGGTKRFSQVWCNALIQISHQKDLYCWHFIHYIYRYVSTR